MPYFLGAVQCPGPSTFSAGKAGRRLVDDGTPMPALHSQVGYHLPFA